MYVDRDTFLTALYTVIDDLYQAAIAAHKPPRRGCAPQVSDSEVLTLLLGAQWLGWSERQLLAYAQAYWTSYFPRLLSQSAFNRRSRDLGGVCVALAQQVAQQLGPHLAPYEVVDGLPVPLERICRGQRHRLFADLAAVGRGGSDRQWYYGVKLLVVAQPDGVISGFVLGPANTEERWLVEALLCWRTDRRREPWGPADLPPSHRPGGGYVGPTGPIWPRAGVGPAAPAYYVADRGAAGQVWQTHWASAYQARVLTPRDYAACDRLPRREHQQRRQVIETVGDHLTQTFHLVFPRARTPAGLLTRIAAKLAAFNCGIWINRLLGRPDFAFATLFYG